MSLPPPQSAPAPIAPAPMWRCDVCNIRTFALLSAAEAHELVCDGKGNEAVPASAPGCSEGRKGTSFSPVISPAPVEPAEEKTKKGNKKTAAKTLDGFFSVGSSSSSSSKKKASSAAASSNLAVKEGGSPKKPRGRPPKGKSWDAASGCWVPSKQPSAPKPASKASASGRPPSKASAIKPASAPHAKKKKAPPTAVNAFFLAPSERKARQLQESEERRRREMEKRKEER